MVFKKFDTDNNNSLDKKEFKKLIITANGSVEEFMGGEMKYIEGYKLIIL